MNALSSLRITLCAAQGRSLPSIIHQLVSMVTAAAVCVCFGGGVLLVDLTTGGRASSARYTVIITCDVNTGPTGRVLVAG